MATCIQPKAGVVLRHEITRAQKYDCFGSRLGCVVVESYAAELELAERKLPGVNGHAVIVIDGSMWLLSRRKQRCHPCKAH